MTTPCLYIVATPIGTLGDFSPRAKQVLESVAFIACEDTRESSKLLNHFEIRTPLEALHEHNERERTPFLLEKLKGSQQKSAALITDAGTPAVSDPGALFVKAARDAGVRILSVPGPSALPSALAASGFIQPRVLFSGFLGRTQREQKEEFDTWKASAPLIAVIYESPKRVLETLRYLAEHFGNQIVVCVSREISKMYEEHIAGPIDEVIEKIESSPTRGEYVVTINVDESSSRTAAKEMLSLEEAALSFFPTRDRIKQVAKENNLSAKDLYNLIQQKRQSNEESQ